MKTNKTLYIVSLVVLTVALFISGCDENRNKATIGSSQDTTSVNKAGGPAIRDTATINKDRRDSVNIPAGKKNNASGNADPSGQMNTKPVKK